MEATLTANELIDATRKALLQSRYTELSLKGIDRTWNNLKEYLVQQGLDYFTRDVGVAFLAHRYGLVTQSLSALSPADRDRLRAIDILADFQAHEQIFIRRRNEPEPFAEPWRPIIDAFLMHEKQIGLTSRTIELHMIYLRRIAIYLKTENIVTPAELGAREITDFLRVTADQYRSGTLYCTASLFRTFLRYLHSQGYVTRDLSVFVPPVRGTKRAHVPSAYPPEDIERLLAAVDRCNPKGRRDYAILLLASRLGLRASDICQLTFSDFHWESNTLAISQRKTGNALVLPLLNEVGEAVIDYLKYGRPTINTDVVFLRLSAPIGPLTSPTLHSIVTQYMRRAGITIPPGKKHGPHALRHSLASAMLHHDAALPVISAVLGHTDSETTAIYLTIDLAQLRILALPVPSLRAEWKGIYA